jgi:hypothetical protein
MNERREYGESGLEQSRKSKMTLTRIGNLPSESTQPTPPPDPDMRWSSIAWESTWQKAHQAFRAGLAKSR